jgi:replication factor C large subunit
MSMATARKQVLPYLEVMTHHCKNRELTVRMAAAYEMEAKHVAFVTGSGEDTNKVQSVVEDAQQLREEAAVEHSGGAFAGGEFDAEAADEELEAETDDGSDSDGDDGDGDVAAEETEASEESDGDDQQSGLADFY